MFTANSASLCVKSVSCREAPRRQDLSPLLPLKSSLHFSWRCSVCSSLVPLFVQSNRDECYGETRRRCRFCAFSLRFWRWMCCLELWIPASCWEVGQIYSVLIITSASGSDWSWCETDWVQELRRLKLNGWISIMKRSNPHQFLNKYKQNKESLEIKWHLFPERFALIISLEHFASFTTILKHFQKKSTLLHKIKSMN